MRRRYGAYWPKRQGPSAVGMKRTTCAGSVPGRSSTFMTYGLMGGYELPGERRQSRYCREMPVPGYQWKVELARHCGDPNVVVRDRPPDPGEFRFHLAVPFAGGLIRQQEDGSLQELADQSQLCFPPLGAERAIMELAQDHPRQVNSWRGFQSRGEAGVVSE